MGVATFRVLPGLLDALKAGFQFIRHGDHVVVERINRPGGTAQQNDGGENGHQPAKRCGKCQITAAGPRSTFPSRTDTPYRDVCIWPFEEGTNGTVRSERHYDLQGDGPEHGLS